jgi:hypothetical protein
LPSGGWASWASIRQWLLDNMTPIVLVLVIVGAVLVGQGPGVFS